MKEEDKTIPAPFEGVTVPEGMVWQYDVVIRGGRLTHTWSLKDENLAIHVHACLSPLAGDNEWIGGIEVHYSTPPDWCRDTEPHHQHCWLLGKPCWHDGSSLYFNERIAPMLPHPYEPWKAHDMKHAHNYVTYELVSWHRDKSAEIARLSSHEVGEG